MFDTLSDRLGGVFDKLKGRGALREQDVRDAMREVRIALLEADVALPVAAHVVRLRAGFDRAHFVSATSEQLKRAVRGELQQLFARAARVPA